jgi:uncharacterized repeat protein (TIGR01451 family)
VQGLCRQRSPIFRKNRRIEFRSRRRCVAHGSDLIPAGTVFSLRNYVQSTTLQSVLDFDARDKVASFKPISLTKTSFPASTNTLLAGCVEVFEQGLWGTEYRVPVGADMPTSTPTATLANDHGIFGYSALSIMAGRNGATVRIDADNDGDFEQTSTIAEGESLYVTEVNTGGRVLSDHPVQVVYFSGRVGSNYQSRDTSLLPTYRWSNSYYAPVSTESGGNYRTAVFLYNPATSPITVDYAYRSGATAYTTANVTVPAGGNARVALSPAGTGHSGAYRFYTTGENPPVFYAMSAVDADNTSSSQNQAFDGGFTLVGQPSLTTQVLLSLGIGRDPYSATNPSENGNPLWVTTAGNGHTPATVYVDYNGDNAGALIDTNGNKYDVSFNVRELEQLKLFDPDGDQSGMLVYTLDPSVKLAAAWAQDPQVASTAQPGLDVGTLVPPLREGEAGKKSTLLVDAGGDGFLSSGDVLEYDIRGANSARASIPGPFQVQDHLPPNVTYVPGTTRYRFTVGGAWQAWTAIPDDGGGTPFPLDGSGFSVPGNLGTGQQFQVVFNASVKPRNELDGDRIVNTGSVEISPYGLVLPISWTDIIYGSIGDRIWNDLNGDGVQDPGEAGIPNIRVFADLNNNAMRDSGEPESITDPDGNYLLSGLSAGTYAVRVNADDIAAANIGYGPTHDLDGIASPHVAVVGLGDAEDRQDADFGYRVGASVGDRVWMDRNANGLQDPGEPGINGVRVYLDLNGNGSWEPGEPNSVTSGNGSYVIGNLNPGTYAVRVDSPTLPGGATQTYDLNGGLDHAATVTLIAAESRSDLDFGYRGNQSIGDLVWEDTDGNGFLAIHDVYSGRIDINNSGGASNADDGWIGGIQIINGYIDLNGSGSISAADAGTYQGYTVISGALDISRDGSISAADSAAAEIGVPNVRVYLDINGNGTFDSATEPSATTGTDGIYSIGNLVNGTYTVRVDTTTLPASYVQTYDLTSPASDHQASVELSGSSRLDADFGYRNDASIGDCVWNDRNANGVKDPGEPGIEGVLVYIDSNGNGGFDQGSERFAITDVNGYYLIDNLPAGSYSVRVEISTLPQGATPTHDLDGVGSAHSASRTLVVSQDALDVDFGYRSNASVGDRVWNDANANGIQDPGETGIVGVRVYLDVNGDGLFDSATEPSAVTDSSGNYVISNIMPGTFSARVDTSTLPPGYVQTFDLTGPLDHLATFSISANQTRTDIDFGYTQRVVIGDFVWNDVNGNGRQDDGETGIAGATVTVFNAASDTIAGTTMTSGAGNYSFDLMPGTYYIVFDTPPGFARTPADAGDDTSDSDAAISDGRSASVTLAGGQSDLSLDAGFHQPAAIRGHVLADTDDDGIGDAPIPGALLTLLDSAGNPVDGDPLASGVQPVTATTAADGSYAFTGLAPGVFGVAETQPSAYLSVSDKDGGNPDEIHPIALSGGQTSSGNDFIEIEPGVISGHVFAGATPLSGVTITLLDENGDPVDGHPGTPGVQPLVTVTDGNGFYQFSGVRPGIYQVGQTQPYGYDSFGDIDGGDLDIIGDVSPISLLPGQHSGNNNFIETLDTCPDDWTHWKFLHPSETPGGNPDADAYDNFAEFAFAMPHDNGAGSPSLGGTAWIIRPSTLAPGTLEGVFVRPKGAPLNVTYTLQYAADPGDPTLWQDIVLASPMFTTAGNGDCTETVTIHNLETLTGLTGGKGLVRIKADLDDDGGNDEIDHTSFSEPEGWTETPLALCCRTYNNPYLRETVFSGTISGVSGHTLTFTASGGSADLAAILTGGNFQLEVTSGDNEGHRFDIASASGNTVTLASDADLDSFAAPFNTLTGAPSAGLAGDSIVIRRHWTLDELFPPTGFGATGSQSSADQVQLFAGGAWRIFWLYDESDADPQTARWVDAADADMADQGSTILPPGRGMFFNNRNAITSILAYGEVRVNDFIRPLAAGNNLVGGAYPVDQSANSAGGRAMNPANGFFGSRDFKTADSFFIWNPDSLIGTSGYSTYFLLDGAPAQPAIVRWAKVGDASILARDAEKLLLGNRAVFVRSQETLSTHTEPSPWNP